MSYIFLIPATYSDLKEKQISLFALVAGMTLGMIKLVLGISNDGFFYAIALIPGLALIICSYIFAGKIGRGDGLALLILGAIEGYRKCMIITLIGIGAMFGFCLVGLIIRKLNRNTEIPFIPFLTAGMVISHLAGI